MMREDCVDRTAWSEKIVRSKRDKRHDDHGLDVLIWVFWGTGFWEGVGIPGFCAVVSVHVLYIL